MKIYSICPNGRYNRMFYTLLSKGRLINICSRYDFSIDAVILEATVCP